MSTQETLISIIIPVYNTKMYIKKCIESIITQTYKEIEIILIDDGSSDGSSKICDNFQMKDKRIRVIHQENKGVSVARNLGIAKAKGEYITFIDSDDYIGNEYIEKMVDSIKKEEEIIYFCEHFPLNLKKKDAYRYIITGDNNLNIYLAGPIAKLFNTNFIKTNKIQFNEKVIIGEDLLFNVQALNFAENIKFSNKTIQYYYRNNYNSSMHLINYRLIESDILFHETLRRIIKKN